MKSVYPKKNYSNIFSIYYNYINEIWKFRYFIFGTVYRNFSVKYQDSFLGFFWAVFNPLMYILLYSLIFSSFINRDTDPVSSNIPYVIYVFSGMICWNFFSDLLNQTLTMLSQYSNLIKKTAFLKISLPLIVIGNSLINFSIIFVLLFFYLIYLNYINYLLVLWIIPILISLIAFTIGIGVILAILNVFLKDISQFIQIFLQILFWITPIIYFKNSAPLVLKKFTDFNPLSYYIDAFHNIFYYSVQPNINSILFLFIIGLIFCFISLFLFNKFFSEIMDEL
jgi:lipopolysaccharide transport system permease protein